MFKIGDRVIVKIEKYTRIDHYISDRRGEIISNIDEHGSFWLVFDIPNRYIQECVHIHKSFLKKLVKKKYLKEATGAVVKKENVKKLKKKKTEFKVGDQVSFISLGRVVFGTIKEHHPSIESWFLSWCLIMTNTGHLYSRHVPSLKKLRKKKIEFKVGDRVKIKSTNIIRTIKKIDEMIYADDIYLKFEDGFCPAREVIKMRKIPITEGDRVKTKCCGKVFTVLFEEPIGCSYAFEYGIHEPLPRNSFIRLKNHEKTCSN